MVDESEYIKGVSHEYTKVNSRSYARITSGGDGKELWRTRSSMYTKTLDFEAEKFKNMQEFITYVQDIMEE